MNTLRKLPANPMILIYLKRGRPPRTSLPAILQLRRRPAVDRGSHFGREAIAFSQIEETSCLSPSFSNPSFSERCRGRFGFAQGMLFDSAGTSLREVPAPLKMTTWKGRRTGEGARFSANALWGSGRKPTTKSRRPDVTASALLHRNRRRFRMLYCAQKG